MYLLFLDVSMNFEADISQVSGVFVNQPHKVMMPLLHPMILMHYDLYAGSWPTLAIKSTKPSPTDSQLNLS